MAESLVKPNRPVFTDLAGLAAMVANGDRLGRRRPPFRPPADRAAARCRRPRRPGPALHGLGRRPAAGNPARGGRRRLDRHLLLQPRHFRPAAALPRRRRGRAPAGPRLDRARHDRGAARRAAEPAQPHLPAAGRLGHDEPHSDRPRGARSAVGRTDRRGRRRWFSTPCSCMRRAPTRAATSRSSAPGRSTSPWSARRGRCWSRWRRSCPSGRSPLPAARR